VNIFFEIRMIKDQNGILKGYCFVCFATKEAAMKTHKEKNNITLQGKKIGVVLSLDKDILFLGNLQGLGSRRGGINGVLNLYNIAMHIHILYKT
jgi:RNA recognition motif-containing protein